MPIDVILLSRNSTETKLKIFNSIAQDSPYTEAKTKVFDLLKDKYKIYTEVILNYS